MRNTASGTTRGPAGAVLKSAPSAVSWVCSGRERPAGAGRTLGRGPESELFPRRLSAGTCVRRSGRRAFVTRGPGGVVRGAGGLRRPAGSDRVRAGPASLPVGSVRGGMRADRLVPRGSGPRGGRRISDAGFRADGDTRTGAGGPCVRAGYRLSQGFPLRSARCQEERVPERKSGITRTPLACGRRADTTDTTPRCIATCEEYTANRPESARGRRHENSAG